MLYMSYLDAIYGECHQVILLRYMNFTSTTKFTSYYGINSVSALIWKYAYSQSWYRWYSCALGDLHGNSTAVFRDVHTD